MKNTKIGKVVIKAALLLPLALCLSGCGAKSVNLNDYLTIECKGIDTAGKASFSVDVEQFVEDNAEALGLEDASFGSLLMVYDDFYDKLDGELDKTSELSNGDKITFKWDDIDTKKFKEKYSVKLTFSDVPYEVSGLEEAKAFNPFDYITVTCEGFAPYGKLSINRNGESPISGISYRSDKADGLSNGDKVIITAETGSDLKEYCMSKGYLPSETEFEYTVSGLASYATRLDFIPVDAMTKMDSHAQDVFNASVAKSWNEDNESLKDIKLIGNYFLTPKDASISTNNYNYVYFIYKVTAENTERDGAFDYYYYSCYKNIILLDDGTCSFDLNDITVPEGSSFFGVVSGEAFSTGKYYYSGYEDLD
ncbi:MAG: hypothetical protein K2K34_00430, partial [Oscillospiraceae bacterium]|nr:hypothetical protein [Oscillospiraceae bacterium]